MQRARAIGDALTMLNSEVPILTTGMVGRALEVSPESVRNFVRRGLLRATLTASGVRLFDPADVERFKAERTHPMQEGASGDRA